MTTFHLNQIETLDQTIQFIQEIQEEIDTNGREVRALQEQIALLNTTRSELILNRERAENKLIAIARNSQS